MSSRKWIFIFVGVILVISVVYVGIRKGIVRSLNLKMRGQLTGSLVSKIVPSKFFQKEQSFTKVSTSTSPITSNNRVVPLYNQQRSMQQPYGTASKSYLETQNTLKTIEDINRINRMNQKITRQTAQNQNPNKK